MRNNHVVKQAGVLRQYIHRWHLLPTQACGPSVNSRPGPRFNTKLAFPRYGIPMLKIKRSPNCLTFNMGIPILVRRHLYIETAPRWRAVMWVTPDQGGVLFYSQLVWRYRNWPRYIAGRRIYGHGINSLISGKRHNRSMLMLYQTSSFNMCTLYISAVRGFR